MDYPTAILATGTVVTFAFTGVRIWQVTRNNKGAVRLAGPCYLHETMEREVKDLEKEQKELHKSDEVEHKEFRQAIVKIDKKLDVMIALQKQQNGVK